MKKLKLLVFGLAFSFSAQLSATTNDGGLEWFTDFDLAHQESAQRNLPIFGFFTGSDWCGWCIQLQKNVFVKQAFIDWAKENVILLELDFPKRKTLSQEQMMQNHNLQNALGVAGYPTVWLFKSSKDAITGSFSITKYGSLGYPTGAVRGQEEDKFLSDANAILATIPPVAGAPTQNNTSHPDIQKADDGLKKERKRKEKVAENN